MQGTTRMVIFIIALCEGLKMEDKKMKGGD